MLAVTRAMWAVGWLCCNCVASVRPSIPGMFRSMVMRSTVWVADFSKASGPLLASIMVQSGWACVIKARIIMRDRRESSTMSTVGTEDIWASLVMMYVAKRLSLLETTRTLPPHNSLPRGRSGPGRGHAPGESRGRCELCLLPGLVGTSDNQSQGHYPLYVG